MNRRAFLGSGLASLFVGVFALLMGGALPRPKAREGKAVRFDNSPLSAKDQAYAESLDLSAAEAELGITPAPDHLRILKPWDGKASQSGEMSADVAYGYYDSDPRVKGLYDMDAFRDAYTHAKNGTHPDHWHPEGKQGVATVNAGRQFGLG